MIDHGRRENAGVKKQNPQSSRQNSRPSRQSERSFLGRGNKSFRLKFARCCLKYTREFLAGDTVGIGYTL
jgi:hypothetical protein